VSATFSQMMDAAEARTATRDWRAAADAYAAAAHLAGMGGRVEEAWQAWFAAGACWRRADEVGQAERCLRRALELTEDGGTACLHTAPQLAGVLVDLGEAESAEDLLESIVADAGGAELQPVFVDTRIGALISLGRKEAARVLLAGLRERGVASGPASHAIRARTAQLLVLDGELVRARQEWRRLSSALTTDAETNGPAARAAVLAGLGEVDLLLGEERRALDQFEDAAECWREAGRESLVWATEAARVRAMVALGVTPFPGLLTRGLDFARERGLRPLEAALLLARGLAQAGNDAAEAEQDLDAAMELAMVCGLPVLVGRAAFARAGRLPIVDTQRQHLLDSAAMASVSHVPLAARVALARARLLARFDPTQARRVARACLPRLEHMNMRREVLAARALVRQLGGPLP